MGQQHLVFVYGTLMHGEDGHRHLAGCRFQRDARTPPHYELVDVGGYPGLVVGGTTSVRGELYVVDEARLPAIDEYEDMPRQYLRREIELEDGTVAEAYLLHPELGAPLPRIATGDWRRR